MSKEIDNVGNDRQLREMHLFAGAGGGILGGMLCGHRTVCAVEIEEYPRRVLLQRQRDGILPRFPIWDNVCTFDGKPWRGSVDVICGGFPCQDISAAGKGAGITGARSGLWKEYARIISEVRPKYVFAENSPLLRTRGLKVVLEDLAEMGYDAKWGVLGAWHVGHHHKRERMWILANANGINVQRDRLEEGEERKTQIQPERLSSMGEWLKKDSWIEPQPGLVGVAHGVADRVDRTKAIGNGQVPAVASLAWDILNG
jgi:DNA (cytosine-5)-methyltransferase 1